MGAKLPSRDTVEDVVRQYQELHHEGKKLEHIANVIGVPSTTLRRYIKYVEAPPWDAEETVTYTPVPDIDDINELLEARKKQFSRKKAHEEAVKLDRVKVKISGPIGILHFGDPHVDDDGTDIQALEAHTELCRTVEGLYAANLGDTTNNWVGRLARLYADQSTTAAQAWMLAEWFVKRCHWLYMIGGNHDTWSGSGDPLKWIARQHVGIHRNDGARIEVSFPNGAKTLINARHDHPGHSQWNPAHGAMKSIQMGTRDHITIHGHKHVSGYGIVKDSDTGRICHAIPVASYKVYDRYAKERGFKDSHISPSVVTVIDPSLPDSCGDHIKVFFDPHEGADYLTYKRRKHG